MSPSDRKVSAAVAVVRRFCKTYGVKAKSKSWFHRLIGRVPGFGANYMARFWTTIGFTSSWPTKFDQGFDELAWVDVLHEGRHAADASKITRLLFGWLYILPQSLGVTLLPVLLFLGAPWWALLSAAVLAVAPLPAVFRAVAEFRAYTVSVAAEYWSTGTMPETTGYQDYFTTSEYYWMFPLRQWVRAYFESVVDALKEDRLPTTPYLEEVRKLAASVKAGNV